LNPCAARQRWIQSGVLTPLVILAHLRVRGTRRRRYLRRFSACKAGTRIQRRQSLRKESERCIGIAHDCSLGNIEGELKAHSLEHQ